MAKSAKKVTGAKTYGRATPRSPFLKPFEFASNMLWRLVRTSEVFNTFASTVATLIAIFGTGAAQGAISLPKIPLADAPFPVRLIVFLFLAAGMGWMLGSITNLVRRIASHARYPFAALAALLLAGLVAGAANWLFSFRYNPGPIPLYLLMVLLGTLLAIRATAINFHADGNAAPISETRLRSAVMATFSAGVGMIVLLTEMGVR